MRATRSHARDDDDAHDDADDDGRVDGSERSVCIGMFACRAYVCVLVFIGLQPLRARR